ncbi:unnamed protein product [Onchocerca flexuosa]|uniref:DUF2235 domain-containing protein n=1 Tax=Onchocerca flexuosa TaxID=387005 RepID=A0A183HZY2_9BILA|nr:unnamed protein product [Onchocerca flexuosa]
MTLLGKYFVDHLFGREIRDNWRYVIIVCDTAGSHDCGTGFGVLVMDLCLLNIDDRSMCKGLVVFVGGVFFVRAISDEWDSL